VLQKRIIFFTDNQDLKTPQSELDKLEKEGRLNKAEKTIMIAELKRIVKVNKNAESNREKRRW
jgi:hypothetical protein